MKLHSLAEKIRSLDHAGLVELLQARPELANPPPRHLGELIERLGTQAATQACLERLNAWQLQVLTGLVAVGRDQLSDYLGHPERVEQTIEQLRKLALVWSNESLVIQPARAILGKYPAGLAPVSANPLSANEIERGLTEVGEPGLEVLQRLVWHTPTGALQNARRNVDLPTATSAIDRLLANRLLQPISDDTVILPREVSLHLRQDRLFEQPANPDIPDWPPAHPDELAIELLDRAAVGSAQELVAHVGAVIEYLDEKTPESLATSAISKRDFAPIARMVGSDDKAWFVLELAHQTGLVGRVAGRWTPSAGYEQWLTLAAWPRWQQLHRNWTRLQTWRGAGLNALDPNAKQTWAAWIRHAISQQFTHAKLGQRVDAETLTARLAWAHPHRTKLDLAQLAERGIREASWLGVLAFGRTTILAKPDIDDPGFTPFDSKVVLQSDLTVVAPAPLEPEASQQILLFADRESHGATSVYRLSQASLRRAFDAGWRGEQILSWLTEHSVTEIPSSVSQLVEDVSRQHGKIKVSAISSAIQVEDETVAVTLLKHPQAIELGLQRLGPHVIGAIAEPDEVVDLLREIGLSPMATDEHGVVYRPSKPRATVSLPSEQPPQVDLEGLASELLSRLAPAGNDELIARLLSAGQADVWTKIDYVDGQGQALQDTVRVLSVENGMAHVVVKAVGRKSLPLARISYVQPAQ